MINTLAICLSLLGAHLAVAAPSYNLDAEISGKCGNDQKFKNFEGIKKAIQEEQTLLGLGKMVEKDADAASKLGSSSGDQGAGQKKSICNAGQAAFDSYREKMSPSEDYISKTEKAVQQLDGNSSSCSTALRNFHDYLKPRFYGLQSRLRESCPAP